MEQKHPHRPIAIVALEIERLWKPVHPTALPYAEAMQRLNWVSDMYGHDRGDSIVRYFLSNASTWRGADARRIKTELNSILKLNYKPL